MKIAESCSETVRVSFIRKLEETEHNEIEGRSEERTDTDDDIYSSDSEGVKEISFLHITLFLLLMRYENSSSSVLSYDVWRRFNDNISVELLHFLHKLFSNISFIKMKRKYRLNDLNFYESMYLVLKCVKLTMDLWTGTPQEAKK